MERLFDFFLDACASYGLPVLFAGVFLETAGVPVPGETAVIAAAILASDAGGNRFHLTSVILVTVVAAILGDNMGFWLGRRFARPRLQHGSRFLFLTPQAFKRAEGYFQRYGSWTIFFARFITGLRVVGALAAGTAGMSWPKFLAAQAAGAVAWAVTISLLGYWFGQNWKLLEKWLHRGGWIALAVVVAVAVLLYVWRRFRKRGHPGEGPSEASRPAGTPGGAERGGEPPGSPPSVDPPSGGPTIG